MAELEIPEIELEEAQLELEDRTLGDAAIEKTLEAARGGEDTNPDIAEALAMLASELAIGERYESIWLQRMERGATRVVIDRERGARLRELGRRPTTGLREDRLVGTLVEADFEKRTARLRSPDGKAVAVSFSEPLADDIQAALRRPAELEGRVSFDPKTSVATSVELRQVKRADQLAIWLEHDVFWRNPSVEELRQQRGVEPISDVTLLRDDSATPTEVDAFMAALRE